MNLDAMIEAVAEQAIWSGLSSSQYGDTHWRRVFTLSELIMTQTVGHHKDIVGYAALCHDIGRVNEGKDANHGYRGASIAMRIAALGYVNVPMSDSQMHGTMVIIGKIQDIVSRHCVKHVPDYLEMRIVHDANILDRVRFDGRKSIDVTKFALPSISPSLIDAACELVQEPVNEPGSIIQIEKKLIIPKGI